MTNEWDEYADTWDDNPDVIIYADKAFAALEACADITDLRVFDFGCGTGLLAERMARQARNVVALDGSSEMIEQLARKDLPRIVPLAGFLSRELIQGNPLFEPQFDMVTASSVCAFVPDYDETLAHLKSVMKPDATYIQWDWLAEPDNAGFGMTEDTVLGALSRAGFRDASLTQPFQMDSPKGTLTVLMAIAQNN